MVGGGGGEGGGGVKAEQTPVLPSGSRGEDVMTRDTLHVYEQNTWGRTPRRPGGVCVCVSVCVSGSFSYCFSCFFLFPQT